MSAYMQSSGACPRLDSAPSAPSPPRRMARQDTATSMDSAPSLQTGVYKLRIHGNCPRCHHYHQAANIEIFTDAKKKSAINCERCGQRWLTFGLPNSTCISLLSTETTDPDPREINFRAGLIEMVRSLSAVGSPTALASVPESAGIPFQEDSTKSTIMASERKDAPSGSAVTSKEDTQSTKFSQVAATVINASPPLSVSPVGAHIRGGAESRRSVFLAKLRNVKERVKRIIPSRKKSQKVDKGKGPVDKPPASPQLVASPTLLKEFDKLKGQDSSKVKGGKKEETEDQNPVESPEAAHAQVHFGDDFPSIIDAIKRMKPEERIRWIRDQVTDLKYCYNHTCRCRHAVDTSCGSAQVETAPLASQVFRRNWELSRLSEDVMHAGVHFEDNLASSSRPTSISSLRTSRAQTIVGSDATMPSSGPGPSFRPLIPSQRGLTSPRSNSPRPLSLPPSSLPPPSLPASRFRRQESQGELSHAGSRTSFLTTAAVHSHASTEDLNGAEDSFGQPPQTSENESELQLSQQSERSEAAAVGSERQNSSDSTIHLVNGYRTDDERNEHLPTSSQQ